MEQNVSLSLIPINGFSNTGTYLNGTTYLTTINGRAYFTELKIFSSGRFQIKATVVNLPQSLSQMLAITNFINSTVLVPQPYPYFVFDGIRPQINAYGDDGQPYFRIIKFDHTSKNLYRSPNYDSGCNCVYYNLILTCLGDAWFWANVTDFNDFIHNSSIVSTPNPYAFVEATYSEFYKDYPYPALSSDIIGGCSGQEEIALRVRNRGYTFVLDRGHCAPFTAKAVCLSGICSGESLTLKLYGLYNYTGQMCSSIKILSNGEFATVFSMPGAMDGILMHNSTIKLLNMTNFVNNIEFHSVYSRAVVNENFQALFTVFGDDDFLYVKRNNLTITSECISNTIIAINELGISELALIFNQTGNCNLNVRSSHSDVVVRTFKIIVENNSQNQKKYLSINPTVIFK